MMGEVSLETSPKSIMIQDMTNSEYSINTTESTNTNIFKIVSFVGFYYQIFVTQAIPPVRFSWSFPFGIKSIIKGSVHFILLVESSSEISELIVFKTLVILTFLYLFELEM